jgi:hypothetical protein
MNSIVSMLGKRAETLTIALFTWILKVEDHRGLHAAHEIGSWTAVSDAHIRAYIKAKEGELKTMEPPLIDIC